VSLFSDPSWKKAFIWAVIAHVIFLLVPTIVTQYWPLKPKTPKVVTIDLFNVAPYKEPKIIKHKKRVIKKRREKRLIKVKKTIKKTKVKVTKKAIVKHKKASSKALIPKKSVKKSKKVISIHPKKTKKIRKKRREIHKKKVVSSRRKHHYKKRRISHKKKVENFDKIISQKIKQIQQQVEEKKREQYLAQQLKELEKVVQQKAKQRYNQALRNYLARYVYPELHRNWAWPEGLSNEPLECIIVIDIDEHGNIIKKWIEKGSGNQLFDQSALRAVEESGPFPPLPPPLRPGPLEIGIRFRPNQIGK